MNPPTTMERIGDVLDQLPPAAPVQLAARWLLDGYAAHAELAAAALGPVQAGPVVEGYQRTLLRHLGRLADQVLRMKGGAA